MSKIPNLKFEVSSGLYRTVVIREVCGVVIYRIDISQEHAVNANTANSIVKELNDDRLCIYSRQMAVEYINAYLGVESDYTPESI